MSLIKNIIKDNKSKIVDAIFDDQLKDKLIKKLNSDINIPIIGEDTEEKILVALYDAIEDVVKEVIIDKI
jgi:hypothetical protein|tara:strand:+ start:171 stop:380 length:210 start_codon:yes stop_codon:yes gene_type:complete